MKINTTAAIYARVSTELQAETGYSLQTQIDACCKKARDLDISTILKFVDDGYSGVKLDRPALNELRTRIQKKDIDIVICYDPDRLARKLAHQLIITDEIEKYCNKLLFVSVTFEQSAEGRLFYSMRGAFSEYEREKILERIIRGKKGKLKAGKIGNHNMYGYAYDPQKETYIIKESEAIIIRDIFKHYINGENPNIIAEYIQERYGFKIWRNKKYTWNKENILSIVKKDVYTGVFHGWKYAAIQKNGKQHIIKRDQKDWIDIPIPAIISRDDYIKAMNQSASNFKNATRHEKIPQLLTRVGYCTICNNPLKIQHDKGKIYYYCNSKKCSARRINSEYLDNIVWQSLQKICSTLKNLKDYIYQYQNIVNIKESKLDELEKTKNCIDKLINERETLLTWFSKGIINMESIETKLIKIKHLLVQYEKKEQKIIDSIKGKKIKENYSPEKIYHCFHNSVKITKENRRIILRNIIDKIYIQRLDNNNGRNPKLKISVKFLFK